MTEHKLRRVLYQLTWALIFVSFFFVLLIFGLGARVADGRSDARLFTEPDIKEYSNGWLLTDGGMSTTLDLPFEGETTNESITLERTFPSLGENAVLLFDLNRMHYDVYIDGILSYSQNETTLSQTLMIKDYGIVDIPGNTEHFVKVVIYTTDDHDIEFERVYAGDRIEIVYMLLRIDRTSIISMVVLLFLSLVILACLIVFSYFKLKESRFGPLLLLLLLALIWAFFDSNLTVFTTISTEICTLIAYYSLMCLSSPLLYFTYKSLGWRARILRYQVLISLSNIIIQTILSLLNVFQLNEMLLVTHVVLLSSVFLGLFCAWHYGIHKAADEKERRKFVLLFFAFLVLAIDGVLTATLYWMDDVNGYRTSLLFGIVAFIAILLVYTLSSFMQEREETNIKLAEREAFRKLAMIDVLTGLGNRRSFENSMTDLLKTGETNATLFMMDMNGLKITNDSHGHNAGDDLIAAAAKAIKYGFDDVGECFRIGGDEFTVLIQGEVPVEENVQRMLEFIQEYNEKSTNKLSIAYGYSTLLDKDGNIRTISEWKEAADLQMYLHKATHNVSKEKERDQDLQDIINYIVATVEAKDRYTAQHSNRVRKMSVIIGKALGMSAESLEELDMAAHVHDIGKIGIPDGILFKPGSLTSEERMMINDHTRIGYTIVSKSRGMGEIPSIILHHHERYDGKGYPDGLEGKEIPLCSRIIAIADSIDAMTSARVYRGSIGLERCRKEVESNLGTMYDPAIGKIALEQWDQLVAVVNSRPEESLED